MTIPLIDTFDHGTNDDGINDPLKMYFLLNMDDIPGSYV